MSVYARVGESIAMSHVRKRKADLRPRGVRGGRE